MRSLAESSPKRPLAFGRGTNVCPTGPIALKCLHGISKGRQHDERGFRRLNRAQQGFNRFLANCLGDDRDLVVVPTGAARIRAVVAKRIIRGSLRSMAECVLPACPRNPVPCTTRTQVRRLNRRGRQ